jgi:hypothetical protein
MVMVFSITSASKSYKEDKTLKRINIVGGHNPVTSTNFKATKN